MFSPSVRRSALLGFAALLGVVPSLASQAPAHRRELVTFRDSLAGIVDSTRLFTIEKQHIAQARRPELYTPRAAADTVRAAMLHLRLGFISLRLGEVVGRASYDSAASEFTWATELAPKWPYGWFGLGLAELGVGDAGNPFVRGLQTMLGKDALTRAANDFARSAEVDSSFVEGLVELSNTALRQRINARMDVALAALRRAAHSPVARNPQILLARGGSSAKWVIPIPRWSPSVSCSTPNRRTPWPCSSWHARASPWADSMVPTPGTAASRRPTPKPPALYRRDLSFIMDSDSLLRSFDQAKGAERVAEVRRFWDARDRDELHRPGERLREHYRRLDYAARQLSSGVAQPPVQHRGTLPLDPGGVRRPGRDLDSPGAAE